MQLEIWLPRFPQETPKMVTRCCQGLSGLPNDRPRTSQDSSKRSPSYPRPHLQTIRTPQMPSATGSAKGHLEVEWALWKWNGPLLEVEWALWKYNGPFGSRKGPLEIEWAPLEVQWALWK